MDNKPRKKTTISIKQGRQTLLLLIRPLCKRTREAVSDIARNTAADQAYSALLLALRIGLIEGCEYHNLTQLVIDANYQRAIELNYDQPPYTGADRAKECWLQQRAAA
ncbi:hypothetical protein [Pseudomonas indica]|uniref:Uncharacterized protein n=1 Tax=Pseudomonas indica TaxID=137658 RepID=A0A1G8V4A3_9PSED|nr:hypothetical protein [Pseudomonas indica]SDJ60195.1 hypothetical protein SAMN05216186_10275 [Pseudomonas indica]